MIHSQRHEQIFEEQENANAKKYTSYDLNHHPWSSLQMTTGREIREIPTEEL